MPIPSQSESIADTLLGGGVQDVKPSPMFLLVHFFLEGLTRQLSPH